MSSAYDYRVVEVLRVVDGDTLDLRLDVGFYLTFAHRFRLLGVDTPERGEAGFFEAKDFVNLWCSDRQGQLRARTAKADSFGRWLADVNGPDGSLSAALVAAGRGVQA